MIGRLRAAQLVPHAHHRLAVPRDHGSGRIDCVAAVLEHVLMWSPVGYFLSSDRRCLVEGDAVPVALGAILKKLYEMQHLHR